MSKISIVTAFQVIQLSPSFQKAQLLNLRNRVRELRAQLEGYEGQIGSEFLSQLSRNEQAECERLQVRCWVYLQSSDAAAIFLRHLFAERNPGKEAEIGSGGEGA